MVTKRIGKLRVARPVHQVKGHIITHPKPHLEMNEEQQKASNFVETIRNQHLYKSIVLIACLKLNIEVIAY